MRFAAARLDGRHPGRAAAAWGGRPYSFILDLRSSQRMAATGNLPPRQAPEAAAACDCGM